MSPPSSPKRRTSIQLASLLIAALVFLSLATTAEASSLRSIQSVVFTKLADLTRPPGQKKAGSSPFVGSLSSTDAHSSASFGMGWKTVDTPVVRLFDGTINQLGFDLVPTGADDKLKPLNASLASAPKRRNPRSPHIRASENVVQNKPRYPGGSSFKPINPPSIPLIVKGPYLSAWLPSGSLLSSTPPNKEGNGGYLAGQYPAFWTSGRGADGEFRLGMHGYIRIDGKTYQFMGNGFGNLVRAGPNANQLSFEYTATRSIFKFEANGVYFTVTFFTPITPDDYTRQSLPLSYVHFELDKLSATFRKVQLFMDIDERWVTGHDYDYQNFPYTLDFGVLNGTQQYFITRETQQLYTEFRQRAEWGSASFAIRDRPGITSINQNNIYAHTLFINNGVLPTEHYQIGGPDNSFAFAVDFNVKDSPNDALFSIGHFRIPYVSYVRAVHPGTDSTKSYSQNRFGYWQAKFPSIAAAVAFHLNDYEKAIAGALTFDKKIQDDSNAAVGGGFAGAQYAAITALSVRQAMATIEFTLSQNTTSGKFGTDVLVFLKEISSNGDCQTVDVILPLAPILSYLNPDILRRLLDPLFKYVQSGLYPNPWAVHDLGTYPNAFGYPQGNDEPMPVEESAGMIVMVLHYAQLVGSKTAAPYLTKLYPTLAQWTRFLLEHSLIPASQLSTDDFAGTASNQTNLAIKGIIAIGAMANIADLVGQSKDAAIYRNISRVYISAFHSLAVSKDGTHTKLLYQQDDSWGTLYNLFWDRVLNLSLVPKSIYSMQDKWYPRVQEKYGVPLDSRHKWTKSDWGLFAAATSASSTTRNLFVGLFYNFISNGYTDVPMTDLYETVAGDLPKYPIDPTVSFLARPVVGGHFAILARQAADRANGVSEYAYGPEPTKVAYTDAELDAIVKDALAQSKQLSTGGKSLHWHSRRGPTTTTAEEEEEADA